MRQETYSKGVFFICACGFLLGTVFAGKFALLLGIDNEYDLKRFIVIGSIWLLSLGLIFVRDVEFVRFSRVTKVVVTFFCVLAFCSSMNSKHFFWGMVELANIGLLASAFFIFTTSVIRIDQDKLFFGVYICFLLFSLFTFVKYILFLLFFYIDAQTFDIHGLISGYVNVRFFNQLQVMIIPLLFFPFFYLRLERFKAISFVAISLHWAIFLQTEARGGILSLILASFIIMCFLYAGSRKQFLITSFKTMFVGVLLWLVFIVIIPYWLQDITSFQIRTTSSGRVDLWLYVLKLIPESLWLGFGPMSFSWAEGKPLPNAHPHNSVMQVLYEYGVVVCITITTWVISRVYKPLVTLKQLENISILPIVYAVLAGLIYSFFSGVAVMPFAQLLFVFLLATQIQSRPRNVSGISASVRGALFFSMTLISCLILYSYKHIELNSALFPRVWINGILY